MSFFEKMNKSILGANLTESVLSGTFYSVGDITSIESGSRTLRLPGTAYKTSTRLGQNAVVSKISDRTITTANKIGLATSVLNLGSGFYFNGLSGLADAAIGDVAISNALARYGHSSISTTTMPSKGDFFFGPKTSQSVVYGKYFGQALMNKIPLAGSALNAGSYLNKTIWASIGYGLGSSVLPVGGSVTGMYGAALGAKYSGVLGASAIIAGGAGAVAYGAYNILNEGLNFRRSQRQVQFDGDTSSFMTQAAATQRARAVQAMQKSHMNARSALGQEATYYSGRNYFRRY